MREDTKEVREPFWCYLVGRLILGPIFFIDGLWFDLAIWWHNADWLHPIRTRKSRDWQTLWEGRLASVDQLIGHETDEDAPSYGQAYLALRLNFVSGIKLLIDRYGPPTASAPRELQPGRRVAVRRNGLGEYRFDQIDS